MGWDGIGGQGQDGGGVGERAQRRRSDAWVCVCIYIWAAVRRDKARQDKAGRKRLSRSEMFHAMQSDCGRRGRAHNKASLE